MCVHSRNILQSSVGNITRKGQKSRRMQSTTSIHIKRSDSAAVSTSLMQKDADCPARQKWAYSPAHTLREVDEMPLERQNCTHWMLSQGG